MEETTAADLFDGQSAMRHPVSLRWVAGGLEVAREDRVEVVPELALTLNERRDDRLVYGQRDVSGWRLIVPLDAPRELVDRLPQGGNYGRWIDRFGLARASLVLGTLSAAVVAAVMTAPNWLGPRVPETWERRIGAVMVGDLAPFTCTTAQSDAALAALVRDVDGGQSRITVQIAKIDMVNAVALPGGRVLIFDQLVQEAKSPDELAGVLAHEIGHVRKRHVMQALLRQFGLSILLSGANSDLGGTLGGVATMGYSRKAEREADAWSRGRLAAADISPAATAAFFGRLRKLDPTAGNKQLGYLNSHPDPGEREQAFAKAVQAGKVYRPALDPAQFAALKAACSQDKEAKQWSLGWPR